MVACQIGDVEIVRELLGHHAVDINAVDNVSIISLISVYSYFISKIPPPQLYKYSNCFKIIKMASVVLQLQHLRSIPVSVIESVVKIEKPGLGMDMIKIQKCHIKCKFRIYLF